MSEPRTEAGRAYMEHYWSRNEPPLTPGEVASREGDLRRILAIEAEAHTREGLDGIVAELMGVEAHLDEARERLIKANATLAAALRSPDTAEDDR